MIMLGDSITAWNPRRDGINKGVPGDATRDVVWRIKEVLEVSKGEKVYLLIGVNDVLMGISKEKIIINYNNIIEELLSVTKDIVCLSILPILEDRRRNDLIDILNREIEKIALNKGVEYINIRQEVEDSKGCLLKECTVDGIHLNTLGYERINKYYKEDSIKN